MTQTTPTRDEAVLTDWKLVPIEPTPEMMASGERAWMNRDLSRPDSNPISDCYRAMLASAPAPASGGVDAVAVKALEWRSHAWGAEADGGRYRIEDNGTNWTDDRYWLFVNVGLLSNHRSKFATLDEAKAAAQADYEKRIRSALSPAATPVSEAEAEAGSGPYTCIRCLSGTWNDDDICDDCKADAADAALAKPASSPAGGDVVREALQAAEPFVELLHSVTNEKRARAIVWRALKQVRAALSQPTSAGRVGK